MPADAFEMWLTVILALALTMALAAGGTALLRLHLRRESARPPRLSSRAVEALAAPYRRRPPPPAPSEGVMRPPMVRRPEKGE
jgi:hypothetical protein